MGKGLIQRRLNILFIGNSHTYLHNMPRMLAELVKAANKGFVLGVRQCTGEGVSLEWHWKNPQTRETIVSEEWDAVVLQDRSGGPLENLDSFNTHTRLLDKEIKNRGAETLLFMTWPLKSRPQTLKKLAKAYTAMARDLGAKLAPVGLAWQRVAQLNPDFELYHQDGRHANPFGAYLAACVFFAVLFAESPEGLPGILLINGTKRVDLDPQKALFLQEVAFEMVSEFSPLSVSDPRNRDSVKGRLQRPTPKH